MDNRSNLASPILSEDVFATISCDNPFAWWNGLEAVHPDPADWTPPRDSPHRFHLEKLEGRHETGRNAQDEFEEDEG